MDSAARFSNRAHYYDAYRPKYPNTLVDFLRNQLGFSTSSIVADIGSGTGILTELLLGQGGRVFAVEPNSDMRKIAEMKLSKHPGFASVEGSAEATTLQTKSVDFITTAQAFHWFRPNDAKAEFRRILKPMGWVVIIWNTRKRSTPFLDEYEGLVNWVDSEKRRVKHENANNLISQFLGTYEKVLLPNYQQVDLEGMLGRLMSSSYFPLPGSPLHDEAIGRATELFNRHRQNGLVTFEYWTEVYAGQLG
jgi:ubiquinone/menaquinone biosynthesis C-methylase UbiE